MRTLVAVAVAALLFAVPAGASAQEDDEAAAHALYEEGREAYARGEFERARERFRASLARYPHPAAMLSLGLAAERAGDAAEAVEQLERYLASGEVAEDAGALRARIERLRRTPVEVVVRSTPLGARVHVDGAPDASAATPATLSLSPGHHVLRLVADGYAPLDQGLEVVLGTSPAPLELALEAAPARVRVAGAGAVRVDGEVVGEAPWEGVVEPGPREVRIADAITLSIVARPGETVSVAASAPAAPATAATAWEMEVVGLAAAVPPARLDAGVSFAPGARLGGGLRIGDDVAGVVGLEAAAVTVLEQDRSPSVLGALRVRGGLDVLLLAPIRLRVSAALGLGLMAYSGEPAGWLPPTTTFVEATLLGVSAAFELAFAIVLDEHVEIVVAPAAFDLTVLNPLGLLSIRPGVGVRFR